MDLWVVAAAAGAGYAAKNLQNLSPDREGSLREPYVKCSLKVQQESRNLLQRLRDKTCPLRRLAGETGEDDSFLKVLNPSDFNYSDRKSTLYLESEVASYSGDAITLGKNGTWEEYNMGGSSTLEYKEGKFRNFGRGEFITSRKRNALISPRIRLDAQICKDHEKVDDTVCISSMRPVLVTDASRIIKRSSSGSSFTKFDGCREEIRTETDIFSTANDLNLKSSSSERFELVEELQTKPEKFFQQSGSSSGTSNRSSTSQGSDGMLIFIIGMAVGILSATFARKSEVDKLNKKLHQMETLAQDLHEELDMKESLTVKELIDCGDLFQGERDTSWSIQESIASFSDLVLHDSVKLHTRSVNDETRSNTQLMRKIEAELEAELEVLEQNMNASSLERIYNVVEVDPDFEPDIINGDVGLGITNAIHVDSSSSSENGATETAPYHSQPVNFAVCPWELSFRLHVLIESRLQARIKELEIDLGISISFGGRYSSNEIASAYTSQSPGNLFDHENTEDDYPANNIFNKYQDDRSQDFVTDMMPSMWDEHAWSSFMSNEDCRSEDDDGTDESERLLLKQIVERMKSGSDKLLEF